MSLLEHNNDCSGECFTLSKAKSDCLEKLKKAHVRLSKQRIEIIDLLFSGTFTCTKDLYYEAQARYPELGMSTVYRFLKVLSDNGVISNSKVLDVSCASCTYKIGSLKDGNGTEIKAEGIDLQELVRLGLVVKGIIKSDELIDVKLDDTSLHIKIKN